MSVSVGEKSFGIQQCKLQAMRFKAYKILLIHLVDVTSTTESGFDWIVRNQFTCHFPRAPHASVGASCPGLVAELTIALLYAVSALI
jgi:hypothetical protein